MGLKNDMNDKDIEITEYLEAETAKGLAQLKAGLKALEVL